MKYFKQLAVVAVTAGLTGFLAVPPTPLFAGNRKGDKLRNEGRLEEQRGNLDHALELTLQAVAIDPADPAYNLQLQRIRFEMGVVHVKAGQKLRDAGNLPEALSEFQKGLLADPSSDIAAQEIRRTREMIDRQTTGDAGVAGGAGAVGMTPSALARKAAQDRIDALMPVAQLRPLSNDLIDLKMTNKPRTLFETLGADAGITVVFDPDYNGQQLMQMASIDLKRTTIETALDQLCLVTKSFWKPLTSNSIFVSLDSQNNRRAFTEQVVKVYYLSNTTTPQEVQEILTVLRTVVDVQKVFNYSAQNALIVRADADVISLIDKLISDLDKPRAEVIIDVIVMSVNSTYIRNLTSAFAPTGINASAAFIPRPGITTPGVQAASSGSTTTAAATVSTIPLNALSRISSADYSVANLPGAQFEAMLNDSSTRVLQAPRLRAANNGKASIKIGDKIPIATGSFQSAVGAVGALPSANTQFSFQDVGVKVEISPQVHDNSEVSMHIDLDVSQVKDRIDVGGVSQPEITQNTVAADIRLHEGEVNLIAGIIKDSDSKAITGIPGLAHIPLIGRLFSGENVERDKQELVIAIIPHIVSGTDITESNLKGVSAGSQTQIKVTYDNSGRRAADAAASASAAATGNAPSGTAAAGVVARPGSPPVTAPPLMAPPATAPPVTAPTLTPPATAPLLGAPGGAPPPPGGAARISFQPSTSAVPLGSTLTLSIYAENVVNMANAGAQLQYDPKILRMVNIVTGELPQRNTGPLALTKNVADDTGKADMRVARSPEAGPVSGAGAVFTVVFQAVGRGNTTVTLGSMSMLGPAGPVLTNTPPPAVVNVQ